MDASLAHPSHGGDWIAELRARGPAEVGQALGLVYDERRRSLSPCPSCGNERRHPKRGDKRGALGLRPDGQGFRCFECDASGDAVALVALVALGRIPEKGDAAWRDVRAAAANAGLCPPTPGAPAPTVRHLPPPPPRVVQPPARLAADSVLSAWSACTQVSGDSGVSGWLAHRGLSHAVVDARGLARALSDSAPLPTWMRFEGETWRARSFRVVVPLYGPAGELVSLHARALAPRETNGRDKAASPSGASIAGLVMADPLALGMLRGTAVPARVVIAEGVPDFLTWAARWGDLADDRAAVLGVISGSWTEEIAARVPDHADVFVRTHREWTQQADGAPWEPGAGFAYADRIVASLRSRCRCFRFSDRPEAHAEWRAALAAAPAVWKRSIKLLDDNDTHRGIAR